jgi:hypothetical protein
MLLNGSDVPRRCEMPRECGAMWRVGSFFWLGRQLIINEEYAAEACRRLMGIRCNCPNGHKLNVKELLAGKRGVCPQCGAKFIIPVPGDALVAGVPLSAHSALSQSIEIGIAPALSHPITIASPSPSPSTIIPVAEVELGAPALELPPAIPEQPIPVADALPTSIVAVPPPIVATPGETTPETVVVSKRERSRRNQIIISLLLLGLVILLAGVLVWVLKREVTQAPVEKTTAVDRAEVEHVFAVAGSGSLPSTFPRVGALEP